MKTIGIITDAPIQGRASWDPTSIESGLSDSDEAVIYLSLRLAERGHRVIVYGDPPQNSPYASREANPWYTRSGTQKEPLDIAIARCSLEKASLLKQVAKRVYFWPNDICLDTYPATLIEPLDGILWLSEWQRQQWSSINPMFFRFTTLFGYGIEPKEFGPVRERDNPYSCIYASNDARGLDILLRYWAHVKRGHPKATLDIYYGWQHWDALTPREEQALRSKLKILHPLGVKEHGRVGQRELNRAFENSSLWTYPCTSLDPFCITALRAQLTGAIPVAIVPQQSALSEIVRSGICCNAPEYYGDMLQRTFSFVQDIPLPNRKQMGNFINAQFTWEKLAIRFDEITAEHN